MLNKFLIEIFDDYKLLQTDEERILYENQLIDTIWERGVPYRMVTRNLDFQIKEDLIPYEFISVFSLHKNLSYKDVEMINTYQRNECIASSWLNLVRFQIGFIYTTRYLEGYCYNKEYEINLRKVKEYYYQIVAGRKITPRQMTKLINQALSEADRIKKKVLSSKSIMTWGEYVEIVNNTVRKCLRSYTPLDTYIQKHERYLENYLGIECGVDSYPCAYFRKSLRVNAFKHIQVRDALPHYLKKKKISQYGIDERYGRCQQCGKTIVIKSNAQKFCTDCKQQRNKAKQVVYNEKRKIKRQQQRECTRDL